jgi:hypothetical protein
MAAGRDSLRDRRLAVVAGVTLQRRESNRLRQLERSQVRKNVVGKGFMKPITAKFLRNESVNWNPYVRLFYEGGRDLNFGTCRRQLLKLDGLELVHPNAKPEHRSGWTIEFRYRGRQFQLHWNSHAGGSDFLVDDASCDDDVLLAVLNAVEPRDPRHFDREGEFVTPENGRRPASDLTPIGKCFMWLLYLLIATVIAFVMTSKRR